MRRERARARARRNRWIVAERRALRSTSGKLLRSLLFSPPRSPSGGTAPYLSLPPSRSLCLSCRRRGAKPFAFFGRSSRKPERGSAGPVFTPRRVRCSPRDPLHNRVRDRAGDRVHLASVRSD